MKRFRQRNLRTPQTQLQYDALKAKRITDMSTMCPFCMAEKIQEFSHWAIIKNDFPYDEVSSRHDLLVSLHHCSEVEIPRTAWDELRMLKQTDLNTIYDLLLEPLQKNKSVPEHFHLHLIIQK